MNIDDLKNVFDFMYTGHVSTTETLFRTAKALGVTTLCNLVRFPYESPCVAINENHSDHLMSQCSRYYQENRFTDLALHCEVN